ncbi:MAG: T9SS type A sorting domain-containing protein [Marinoscillum sp.]
MRKSFVFLLLLSTTLAFSQSTECGTRITKKQKEILSSFDPSLARSSRQYDATLRRVGIVAHIIRKDNGVGGLTELQLSDAIEVVNDYYASANIQFFVAETNEILSTKYFDFNTADESAMGLKYDVNNVINIYFTNSVGDNQGTYCGYAYFPGGPDRILMDNSCAINGSTLPHEIGHFFTLYHTHGKDNSQLTDELVNGSNCTTAGDEICDTPADPLLSFNNVNSSCVYTGNAKDANGAAFKPDPRNIMSYARKECRDVFSTEQFSRMDAAYDEFRSYLISKAVVADFDQNVNEVCAGVNIQFTDKSIGAESWFWYFEGGTPEVSSDQSPMVLYETGGTFDVRLIVKGNGDLADTLLIPDHVNVTAPPVSNLIKTSVGFETNSSFKVENKDNGLTFERTNTVSTKGSFSIFVDFFNYESIGQEDYLILNSIDNTFSTTYELTFDYAYTYYNQEYSDGLALVYKGDCDTEWTTLWSASGPGLATTSPQTGSFKPVASQWKNRTISFEVPDNLSVYELAFKSINGYGNNLYIDNIALTSNFTTEVSLESCVGSDDATLRIRVSGSESYEYSIDGESFVNEYEFLDLQGGTYTVMVRDSKGRILTKNVELIANSLSMELEDVSCNGAMDGSATFDVSGNDEYEYSVDGVLLPAHKATGLAGGTHEILIHKTSNGCEYAESFELSEPEPISLDYETTNAKCAEGKGTLSLTAVGGTGEFTYLINEATYSSPVIEIGAGDYEIKVVDENGCEAIAQATVTEPEAIELSVEFAGLNCEGDEGTLSLSATGGFGELSYFLDDESLEGNVVMISEEGIYTVRVVDANGCERTEEVEIDFTYETPDVPQIRRTGDLLAIEHTDFEITWYLDGEVISDANTESLEFQAGVYKVSLSNPGGFCEVFSQEFEILGLGIDPFQSIAIVPNPIAEVMIIKFPDVLKHSPVRISVFTLSGQLVHAGNSPNVPANWEPGVYLVQVLLEQKSVIRKVIKK